MKAVLFTLVVAAFLLGSVCLPLNVSGSDEASVAIGEADNALRRAFNAVWELESIGANVSGLMVKLNEAGALLAAAENAYRMGNFSDAFSRAEGCSMLAEGVLAEASSLKSSALADAEARFSHTLMFSIAGAVVFVVFLVLVWVVFAQYYGRRLLRMKPEVTCDVDS